MTEHTDLSPVVTDSKNRGNHGWAWVLALTFLSLPVGVMLAGVLGGWNVVFVWLFVAGLAYFLMLSIKRLFQRRWASAVRCFLCLVFCAASIIPAAVLGLVYGLVGEDNFAKGLTIPDDIEISLPGESASLVPDVTDEFQQRILAARGTGTTGIPNVTASLSNLSKIRKSDPAKLERYLAASPSWRVFREHGNRYATRRWKIDGKWAFSLHGYYSDHDLDRDSNRAGRFQTRLTLGLDGKPWVRRLHTPVLKLGETKPLSLEVRLNTFCHIDLGDMVCEIFEQGESPDRDLTNASITFLDAEMKSLAAAADWAALKKLAQGGVRVGEPFMTVRDSFQGGIYDSEVWVNPGEPGMIYMKAFEVTGGQQLSARRLKERTSEWVGWSDDPQEVFFSNCHFTIYEGDWGQYYAARLEVWFEPDSGAAERKLIEKVFKVEGWMR